MLTASPSMWNAILMVAIAIVPIICGTVINNIGNKDKKTKRRTWFATIFFSVVLVGAELALRNLESPQQDVLTPQSTVKKRTVSFTDPSLERAIKNNLKLPPQEDIPLDMAQSTTRLILTDGPIHSLGGIGAFTNLEVLVLDPCYGLPASARKTYFQQVGDEKVDVNDIQDFTPLLSLKKLRTLVIFCNTCTDLQTISHLTGLTHLRLSGQYIGYIKNKDKSATDDEDAYPQGNKGGLDMLAKLTNLQTLDVSRNYIVDFSPLRHLPNLTKLNIANNGTRQRIADASTLGSLRDLAETKADWALGEGDVQ